MITLFCSQPYDLAVNLFELLLFDPSDQLTLIVNTCILGMTLYYQQQTPITGIACTCDINSD